AGATLPGFENGGRFVSRVIDDDDLVVAVLERCAGVQQAADYALFVVAGDVDRDERLIAEVEVAAVAVAVSISVSVPIGVAVAVSVVAAREARSGTRFHEAAPTAATPRQRPGWEP